MIRFTVFVFLITMVFTQCKEDKVFIPKPRMYPKIEFPAKSFKAFQPNSCDFNMEIPEYFQYIKDTSSVKKLDINPEDAACWFDLYSEQLNSYIHMSYFAIDSRKGFDKLVADAFEMVDKHNVKANYRDEIKVDDASRRLHGILFEIDGPVATPLQFFLTDSTNHFLRGSLYFKSQVNTDSIAPVYSFVKEDFNHLLESFKWNN